MRPRTIKPQLFTPLAALLFAVTCSGLTVMAQTTRPYSEPLRPQFHFTADKGWLNDPNGMVFYKGEYHLFFQRTPDSLYGNLKTWGHAVSSDMLHWQQLADAITPDRLGDIWSGSAVVDWNNTAGFETGDEKTIVAIYTAAGKTFGQCLSYSNDRGRTWTKFPGNPVLPHIQNSNRDPKLVWFEPTRSWILALYLDKGNDYGLFTSPDLKNWTQIQTIPLPHAAECPDFFPINLDNDPKQPRWVLTGANGRYMVGSFDGKHFTPETNTSHVVEHDDSCYAVQTFSDLPDGRRIQIGWLRDGKYPGMPFNQQMGIPCELTLRTTPDGPRLFKNPIKEIDSLHGSTHQQKNIDLSAPTSIFDGLPGDLLDINVEFVPTANSKITFALRGDTVQYDNTEGTLTNGSHAVLKPKDGKITLRILLDRTSIEAFGNDGEVVISRCFLPTGNGRASVRVEGGVKVQSVKVCEMKSAWDQK